MLKNQQSFAPHFPLDDFLHRRRHEPWKGNWWQSCAFCSSCNQLIYSWPSQMFRNPCVTACNTLQTIPERRLWSTWSSSNAKALIFGRRMVHLLSWFPTHLPFPRSKPLSWTCLCCLLAKFTISSLFIHLVYCWAAVTCHRSPLPPQQPVGRWLQQRHVGQHDWGLCPCCSDEKRAEVWRSLLWFRRAAVCSLKAGSPQPDQELPVGRRWRNAVMLRCLQMHCIQNETWKSLNFSGNPLLQPARQTPGHPCSSPGLGRDDTARYLAISLLFSVYVKGKHYKYSQCFEGNCQQDLWGQGPYAADQHPFPQGHSATSRLAFLSFKDTFKGDTFSRSSVL